MWSVSKSDLSNDRKPGISGFMRLRNEAMLLNEAFETHIDGVDELVVVYNNCQDSTPQICEAWQKRYPGKIRVFEYEPEVLPVGSTDAAGIDPRDENSLANYYNYALCKTNHEIVIKIDGDHIGSPARFSTVCNRVRRTLKVDQRWPIFGINVTDTNDGVAVYNFYNYAPKFVGKRIGPPPFTSGDQSFFRLDNKTWHTTDPVYGYEKMPLSHKKRARAAHDTVLFFHCKGFKDDHGTGSWSTSGESSRKDWIDNVSNISWENLATLPAMVERNPSYFAGFPYAKEFSALFPNRRLLDEGYHPKQAPLLIQSAKNTLIDFFTST